MIALSIADKATVRTQPFGEGVNPRLLNHGAPRLVYGLSLVTNLREYLLGIDAQPNYVFPQHNAAAVTRHIVRWWTERWALKRIERDDALQKMAQHRLVHPIRHGARVTLPRTDIEQGLSKGCFSNS